MENDTKQTNTADVAQAASAVPAVAPQVQKGAPQGVSKGADAQRGFRGGPGGNRPERKRRRDDRPRSEFDSKMLAIRRVARVASGGRRFNFSVALVLGNKKGSVGVGTGKAADTAMAIDKATRNGKKNLIRLALTKTSSIPHEVSVKYSSARVMLMPAKGKGLIAGSAVRDVLELAGVHDVSGKIFSGSKNKLNIARATVLALSEFAAGKEVKLEARNQKLETKPENSNV